MPSILFRKALPLAVLMASGLAAGNAFAQLEEVIVTAQKRTQSLQDIPISIYAYDSEAIESMRLIDAQDIGMTSPSLQMPSYPTSSNNMALFIRGIGNADSVVITKDPTVGLYYDGVYAARSSGLLADLAELERVEILRGPQGTLYGRNSTAGAINFISAKPTGELGFKQTAGVGNFDSWRSTSHLNLPSMAGFSAKLTAALSDRDGWVDNSGPNRQPGLDYTDFYKKENEGYRVALRYDGIEKFLADYSFDYSDMTTGPGYFQYGGPVGGLSPAYEPVTDSFTSRLKETRTPTGGGKYAYYLPDTKTKVEGHNLTLSYEINDQLSLKSITGYRNLDDDASQNFAQSFGDTGSLEVYTATDDDQFSQELQLVGSAERLSYVAGLYYYNENGDQSERQYLDRATVDQTGIIALDLTNFPPTPCSDGSTSDPFCTDFAAFYPLYLGEYTVKTDIESWAGFGQATWTPNILNDRLDLTAGVRYTDDQRDAKRTNDGLLWNSFGPGASSSDKDKFDYTAVADYNWTDAISTYTKVATGFRSGGSSRNGLDFDQAFDQETVTSFELGWKSQFMDNSLRFNAAAFYMEVDDIILDYLPDPVNNPQFVEVFNSGNADIYGAEIDMQAAITERFLISFNYAYVDYTINDAIFPDGSDRSDTTELVWAPENAFAVSTDYSLPVSIGELQFHLDYSWQDSQYALANTEFGDVEVAAFGLLNGRISLADMKMFSADWQFAIWGKNLANRDDANYLIGATASTYLQPRTYGAELIMEF
ncbi:MAG: TonB-dependent receptor [Pseudomonadales bacterium]|nr:TonB-dependent receptor [Halioglobus sp.]MCP5130457.1 TonB-dependent receptor [Pseudomonadales bacterium]